MSKQECITLTEEQFDKSFTVQPNHITGNEAFGGMYETYGEDFEYIKSLLKSDNETDQRRVWIILECDGKSYYGSGFHFVNRVGYLVTKESVRPDVIIDVELEDLIKNEEE